MSDVAYDDEYEDDPEEGQEPEPNALMEEEAPDDFLRRLMELAQTEGDLSDMLDKAKLAEIGDDVVEDYQRDKASRASWAKKVEDGLKAAAQEGSAETKHYPFEGASNVNYPLMTNAALQFNARAYPAIVKGDEAVLVKVFGTAATVPPEVKAILARMQAQSQMQPGQPPQGPQVPPEQAQAAMAFVQEVEAAKARHQAKLSRAGRVKDYLNYQLFYEMSEWEADTDALLLQLPIVGCAFRKVWWDDGKHCSALVPALRLVVNMDAKSLETAPRVTEEVPEVYPYQIRAKQRAGIYREVDLPTEGEDDEKARMLLEQHRRIDMDGDGVEEPYIVTVDEETREVLSIQANFSPQSIKVVQGQDGAPVVREIKPQRFYIKYEFFPHPEGKFYSIGFAHLLDQIGAVVNTAINQLNDAANAAVAGGGFITGGLRLQGNGQTNVLRWRPGEYKVVNGVAQDVRQAIYERTIPQPSPITFQLLEMMLGAAKDITATKDVLTGDAKGSNQAVGTTLALIEQGLQVFTAIYKRVYRSLKDEFNLLYECIAKYANDETAQGYAELLDDPQADFYADFDLKGMDIRPVSDPMSVTRMQKVAQAQALMQLRGAGLNDMEINKRVLMALDVEDIEELMPQPAPPDPRMEAEAKEMESDAARNMAAAMKDEATAMETIAKAEGLNMENEANAAILQVGLSSMAGPPGNGMGFVGPQG